MNRHRVLKAALAITAIAAIAFALGVVGIVAVTDDQPTAPPPAHGNIAPPAGDLEASRDAATATSIHPPDAPLRDQTPEDVPADQLQEGQEAVEQAAKNPRLPPADKPLPVGGAQNYSCTQDYSGRVYSSRNGAKPMSHKLHFTVSPNVTGWRDIRGVQSYFKRTRVGSSTYIVDFEAHCLQMVPESMKPWTQGAFNPTSISTEIIATGRETRAQWLASPLIRRGVLASLVRDSNRRHGLPLRRVNPVGCVDQLGVTDHNALECGNNHTDVAPAFPWDVFMRQLTDDINANPHQASSYKLRVLTKGERTNAECLLFERRVAARHGGWDKVHRSHLHRASRCKAWLRARNHELHRLGITNKHNRKSRHTVIHAVHRGRG